MKERTDADEALTQARRAVQDAPQDCHALGRLGALLIELARRRHAQSSGQAGGAPAQVDGLYRDAVLHLAQAERHGDPAAAFHAALHRGIALRELGELDAAMAAFHAAGSRRPEDPRPRRELAATLHGVGENQRSIEMYRALLASDPADAVAHTELAHCLLSEGNFAAGWEEYEWRLQAPDAAAARRFPFDSWKGEPLDGRTLLVRSEQGVGDEVMFASCLPDVIAATKHCVIECSRRLAPLFRRSFPQASVLPRSLAAPPDWATLPAIDCQVMAGSLPRHYRRRREHFPGRPYLVPDPAAVARWRERFGRGRIAGLAWTGGLPTTLRAARSMPLEQLAPLLSAPGWRFASLELYDRSAEIATLQERHGASVAAWKGLGGDLDDFAAAVAALDLVITVPTAAAHVAGAVGTPAWVLAPRALNWRYLSHGEHMPWYASVRVLRRPAGEDIDAFVARVRSALDAWREG